MRQALTIAATATLLLAAPAHAGRGETCAETRILRIGPIRGDESEPSARAFELEDGGAGVSAAPSRELGRARVGDTVLHCRVEGAVACPGRPEIGTFTTYDGRTGERWTMPAAECGPPG